ncbi:hypothetical protein FRB99_005930 [Tulasnella sp. 403]|nr:hypothetical protein FRB99_005930 [Tulasnella sp. 403]
MAISEHGPNTSLVLRGINDVIFEERPVPEPGPDEVLIQVKKTGICGSDVHYLTHGRIGDFVVESPMVLGHESSGIVYKVGSKVKHLKPGDRVAMEPGQSCRTCESCKKGKYELCPDIVFAATPPYDGTLGRYYRLVSDLAYPLPDNLSLEDGAMVSALFDHALPRLTSVHKMEPLSVAVHSVRTIGEVRPNQNVAVFGAGPVGLLCLAVAQALGAKRTIAIDIAKERLDFAKSYAATDIFSPPAKERDETLIDYARRSAEEMKQSLGLTERGPDAVDLIIEASGAPVCVQTGVFLVKPGGTFVQVGMGKPDVEIPLTILLVKEVLFKGSFRYGRSS